MRHPVPWRSAAVITLLIATVAGSAPAARSMSLQEAATPRAGGCEVPTPTPQSQATDGTGGADLGVPLPVASPGTVAVDATTAAALEATARALAACLSAGESDVVAELASERYLGTLAGVFEPLTREEYGMLAASLPIVPVTIRSVTGAGIDPSGAATAEVVYVVANQLVQARWTFVPRVAAETPQTGSGWLVDAEEVMPADAPGAATMGVELDEFEIRAEPETVSGPDVAMTVRNVGEEDHEALVVRLEEGATAADLLQPGPGFPSGISFTGEIVVPAGEEANLVLVDLEPGTYALVCLLPDEDGTPYLALGMETEITVR